MQRDQGVTLIFQTAGLYLTTRGKALDNGTEGDVVNVLNLQSKRTVTGTVTGRGQVDDPGRHAAADASSPTPRRRARTDRRRLADNTSPVTSKPE